MELMQPTRMTTAEVRLSDRDGVAVSEPGPSGSDVHGDMGMAKGDTRESENPGEGRSLRNGDNTTISNALVITDTDAAIDTSSGPMPHAQC